MSRSDLVKIKEFNIIGSDDRGITTDFNIPRKQDQFIFLTRKSGSLSGNTYHQGKSLATNPKIFLLLNGSIRLSYRKIGETLVNSIVIDKPSTIEISTMVTHKVEAISDIMMVECNSIADIQSDRNKEDV